MKIIAAAALAVCALAFGVAPVAHADGRDDIFWHFLQQQGIASAFPSEMQDVAAARGACNLLADRYSTLDVSESVKENYPG